MAPGWHARPGMCPSNTTAPPPGVQRAQVLLHRRPLVPPPAPQLRRAGMRMDERLVSLLSVQACVVATAGLRSKQEAGSVQHM